MQLGFDATHQLVWNKPKDPDGLQGENRMVYARDKAFFKTFLWNATRDWPYELIFILWHEFRQVRNPDAQKIGEQPLINQKW